MTSKKRNKQRLEYFVDKRSEEIGELGCNVIYTSRSELLGPADEAAMETRPPRRLAAKSNRGTVVRREIYCNACKPKENVPFDAHQHGSFTRQKLQPLRSLVVA